MDEAFPSSFRPPTPEPVLPPSPRTAPSSTVVARPLARQVSGDTSIVDSDVAGLSASAFKEVLRISKDLEEKKVPAVDARRLTDQAMIAVDEAQTYSKLVVSLVASSVNSKLTNASRSATRKEFSDLLDSALEDIQLAQDSLSRQEEILAAFSRDLDDYAASIDSLSTAGDVESED